MAHSISTGVALRLSSTSSISLPSRMYPFPTPFPLQPPSPITISTQLYFNQALSTRFTPFDDASDLESGIPQQLLPVAHRALATRKAAHHDHIERRADPIRTMIRDDMLGDEQLAVAFAHGSLEIAEDVGALLVAPIVEDRVKIVSSCACALS